VKTMRKRTSFFFLAPSLALLGFLGLASLIPVIYESLHFHLLIATTEPKFVGLNNFRSVLQNVEIMYSLGITFLLCLVLLVIQIPIGFLLAVFLARSFKGRSLVQTIFVLPLGIAPIAVGCIWKLLLRPEVGPIPRILSNLGIYYNYLETFPNAFTAIVIMELWRWTPFVSLAILPAIVSIPPDILDAARVDGMNQWQIIRYIILPLSSHAIFLVTFIRLMDTFGLFDEVWVLTGGLPGWSTRVIGYQLVIKVLNEFNYGEGSALTLIVLYIVVVLCWLMMVLRAKGKTGGEYT